MNRKYSILSLILITLVILSTSTIAWAQQTPPRDETVVIGGGMWAPPTNFNPLVPWAATTGTIGLIYEVLYLYLPHTNKWVPWLAAEEPKWLSNDTLQIKLRDTYWWDGKPLTSEDVKFTFYDLPKMLPSVYYASITSYLVSVETPDEKTVIFHFNKTALNYPQLYYYLYSIPILPKHVFEPIVKEKGQDVLKMQIVGADKPENIVGSGMYKVYSTTEDTIYYVRNDNWWGKKYFGTPGPKYIKYIMVFSNQVALAMLIRGDLDWSNFFIPGIPQLVKQYNFIVTYYKDKPYYLPANVAYLFINHNKKPLNDPVFRKALYYAIDLNRIVNEVYGGAVLKANPVGLIEIPAWKDFLAKDLLAKYNYTYDPEKAKELLDKAGYIDRNGDGWRDTPDGKTIELKVTVPYGWTDWMQAAIIIADCLKAVGIKAEPDFPAYGVYSDMMYKGEFDLLINNFGSFVSPSPYTLYNWAFWPDAPPVGEYSWSGNFGRYHNDNLTRILEQIAHTPLSDKETLKKLYRELEKILLDEMPYIPLWYNAYWFQATTLHWKGWPTAENPYAVPVTWPGRWQDGGLLVLLHLKPVTPSTPTTSSPLPTTTSSPSPTTTSKTTTSSPTTTKTTSTPTKTTTTTSKTTTSAPSTTSSPPPSTSTTTTPSTGGGTGWLYATIAIIIIIIVVVAAIYVKKK